MEKKNFTDYCSVNGCRHGEKCTYNHNVIKHDEERVKLNYKVHILEKKVADVANSRKKF